MGGTHRRHRAGDAGRCKSTDDDCKTHAFNEAKNFLLDILMDGPRPAKECKAAIAEAGLSLVTVKRAKSKLKIASVKDGMTGDWS